MRAPLILLISLASLAAMAAPPKPLEIAVFQADVTPPLGSPLCFGLVKPAAGIVDPLTARGIALYPPGENPIVLVAVDWLGISNDSHDHWRETIGRAVGTQAPRVSVHVLHQHDAPGHDDTASRLLAAVSMKGAVQDDAFNRDAVQRVAAAARAAKRQRVTHISTGRARVDQVASNRRILGDDGKVRWTRMSSSRIPEAVAAPEGLIDPWLESAAFWNGDQPLAVLTYYATHPQSYYGQGGVSWDFVGLARAAREKAFGGALPHIHFNGAGGNVAAGKYNDGAPEKRGQLAERLAAGMEAAWQVMNKLEARQSVLGREIAWRTVPVKLPLRDSHRAAALRETVENPQAKPADRMRAARDLSFALRAEGGHAILLGRLRVGPFESIYLPGELFIEYQLAARRLAGGRPLAVAAYGDLGPGYIGTEAAYGQGGYETSVVSRTAPSVEKVLTDAIARLLQ